MIVKEAILFSSDTEFQNIYTTCPIAQAQDFQETERLIVKTPAPDSQLIANEMRRSV